MSKLNFASISEAFVLGSDQIKNTQEEISNLRKLITENTLKEPPEKKIDQIPEEPVKPKIWFPEQLDITKHPHFDEIVKNYVIVNHPEWMNAKESFGFGNKYSSTVCSNIERYILFFMSSLFIYLILKSVLN